MKKIFLFINIVAIALLAFFVFKTMKNNDVNVNCTYQLSDFDFHHQKEIDTPNILMLGNSLTRFGKWDSLLQRSDIINRGISGDELACMYSRLTYLKNTTAKICFIEGGINDFPTNDIQPLLYQYKQIVNFWKAAGKMPVINSILYISPKAGGKNISINKPILELNNLLKAFAAEQHLDYIDMNPFLSNGKVLKDEYTTDGIHLTEAAYILWAKEINKVLKKNKL